MRAQVVSGPAWLDTFVRRSGPGWQAAEATLTIEGRQVPARRLTNAVDVRLIAAVRHDVVAVCDRPIRHPSGECEYALGWVGVHGLPPGVSFPPARMSFLDRSLNVPEGCRLEGFERVICPSGAILDWYEGATDAPQAVLAGYFEMLSGQIGNVGQTPIECSLAGRRAVGVRAALSIEGQTLDILLCAVRTGATTSVAGCLGWIPADAPWPVPCDQVFDGNVPR